MKASDLLARAIYTLMNEWSITTMRHHDTEPPITDEPPSAALFPPKHSPECARQEGGCICKPYPVSLATDENIAPNSAWSPPGLAAMGEQQTVGGYAMGLPIEFDVSAPRDEIQIRNSDGEVLTRIKLDDRGEPVVGITTTTRPDDGPTVWYSDGIQAFRPELADLASDTISDRSLRFAEVALKMALERVAEEIAARRAGA